MTSPVYCSSMDINTWNMDFLVTQWYNCHTFSLFSIDHGAIVYICIGYLIVYIFIIEKTITGKETKVFFLS